MIMSKIFDWSSNLVYLFYLLIYTLQTIISMDSNKYMVQKFPKMYIWVRRSDVETLLWRINVSRLKIHSSNFVTQKMIELVRKIGRVSTTVLDESLGPSHWSQSRHEHWWRVWWTFSDSGVHRGSSNDTHYKDEGVG